MTPHLLERPWISGCGGCHGPWWTRLSLLCMLWTAVAAARVSETDSGSVILAADYVHGRPGEQVTIPVKVRDAATIGALQVDLTFDPRLLEPLDVREGPLVGDGAVIASEVDQGRLRIRLVQCDPIEGSGTVFLPRFTVRHDRHRSTGIGLEEVRAWSHASPRMGAAPTTQATVTPASLTQPPRLPPEACEAARRHLWKSALFTEFLRLKPLKRRVSVEPGRFSLKETPALFGVESGEIRPAAVAGIFIAALLVVALWLSVPSGNATLAGSRTRARVRARLSRLVGEACGRE